MSKLEKLYTAYAENVEAYPALLSVLSEQLGVSVESLQALGVGYAPLVEFSDDRKSGPWWASPQRDSEGNITGIALRSCEDGSKKLMVPGSKPGLVYPIRPGYRAGTPISVPGRHAWIRASKAGCPCPVCGRADDCALSADDPKDPKAVICVREGAGSARTTEGGWLHIRKPEANVRGAGPLPKSDHPVLIVEGMTDAAAAFDLGFIAVGRPSNIGGLSSLRSLLAARKCVVVGENDRKADGRWPGRQGVEAVFETLKNECEISKIYPPPETKDLRQWRSDLCLDMEALAAYIKANAVRQSDSRILSSDKPVPLALRWLREEHTSDDQTILRRHAGVWSRWDGTHYARIDEEAAIKGSLYRWLYGREVQKTGKEGETTIVPYEPDRHSIANIVDALSIACPIEAEPPCWLDKRDGPDAKALLCFANGALDVASGELHPLSPHLFTYNALPYSYDPHATCPLFDKFLSEVFADDEGKCVLCQEWAGYLLVPDCSQQKLMVFCGASGSGKSTLLHALASMLGSSQVCSPTLEGLGDQYGLDQFVGRLAAFIGDAELGPRANRTLILNRIKELTGSAHPTLEVRRMRVAAQPTPLYTRLTIACNDLPDLHDSGAALPRRTLALEFSRVFDSATTRPDRGLPDKLAAEAPGILNWALTGLRRLRAQGNFTVPDSSATLASKFAAGASPLRQFVDHCTHIKAEATTSEAALYAAWRNWARENSVGASTMLRMQHALTLMLPSVRYMKIGDNGSAVRGFTGIGLTQEAKDRYLA